MPGREFCWALNRQLCRPNHKSSKCMEPIEIERVPHSGVESGLYRLRDSVCRGRAWRETCKGRTMRNPMKRIFRK